MNNFFYNLVFSFINLKFTRYIYKNFFFFSFFSSFLFNVIRGLSWKLSYLNWKIEKVYKSHSQYSILKILLKKYFLISFSRLSFNNTELFEFLGDKYNRKKINNFIKNLNKISILESTLLLKNLVLFFQHFSSFRKCIIMRQCYRKKLYQLQNNSFFINTDSLQAYLEENRPNMVKKILHTAKIQIINKKKIEEIKNYSNFLGNGIYPDISNKQNYSQKYFNLIYLSKIIVFGPKNIFDKPYYNDRTKIIKIKMNEILNSRNTKKIISYYNIQSVKDDLNKIVKLLPKLLFACFKSREVYFLAKNKTLDLKKNMRIFNNANNLMLNNYGPHHLQNLVYDLLQHKPKSIYLEGVSFFLNKSYSKNYSDFKVTIKSIATQLRIHDPFSNFLFIKNLWKRKLINTSKKISKILNMSELKYAEKLDTKYKNFYL